MRWLIGIVNGLCVTVILLYTAIALPTFCPGFYSMEYDKYQISEKILVSKDDLMNVTNKLLNYMSGKGNDLVVEVIVDGQQREFFNDKEKAHMVDVKNLLMMGQQLGLSALLGFAMTFLLLVLFHIKPGPVIARCNQIIQSAVIVFSALLIGAIALDFDKSFVIFHQMFFNNDLWILDPETDLLLNIVPTGFFIDIGTWVGVLFVSFMAVVIIGCSFYIRRHMKKTPSV